MIQDTASVIEPGHPSWISTDKTARLLPQKLARGLCISMSGAVMKTFTRLDHLKRVDALRDEIDVFRRVCDGAKADALKRRHRRRGSPRRNR